MPFSQARDPRSASGTEERESLRLDGQLNGIGIGARELFLVGAGNGISPSRGMNGRLQRLQGME